MRLIDLIRFIRTSSQMFYHQILTEYERLQLIKLAFPRQDLIKWFDSRAVFPIPPERYMPLLLMNAASAVVPGTWCGSITAARAILCCCVG